MGGDRGTVYVSAGFSSQLNDHMAGSVLISHFAILVGLKFIDFLCTMYITFPRRASIDQRNTGGQNECRSTTS